MGLFDWLFGKKKKKKPNYPPDIYDMCIKAYQESKECVENVNKQKLKNYDPPRVIKQKGDKKIAGLWCWWSKEWNNWVAGLANRTTITIGCNPEKGDEISYDTLKHEFGHFWTLNAYNEYDHHPKYKKCFVGWKNPINVKFVSTNTQTEKTIVDYDFNFNG